MSAARSLVAVAEVALAPRQPLVELGVVDAAVEEDDESQPGATKRADEVPHVAPQLQELALALLLRSMLSVVVMDGPVQPLA